jgi:tetratricopeptide (TPR) repeat protein
MFGASPRVRRVGVGLVATVLAALGWLAAGRVRARAPMDRPDSAYARGDWRGAAAGARAALQLRRDDRAALRLLARSAARLGRDDSAEAIYRRLGVAAMQAEDLFLLGRGLLRRGQVAPALAALGAARDADPDHPETLEALARHDIEAHRPIEATEAAERLARVPGWEARGAVLVGRLRLDAYDPAGAAAALADALRRDPELRGADCAPEEARKLRARALLQDGRPVEARRLFSAESPEPADPEVSWLLSRARLQEGDRAGAVAALEAARGFVGGDPLRAEPAPFVGAARCAECHRANYRAQQDSRHARTLHAAPELRDWPLPAGAVADPVEPRRVSHRLHHIGGQVRAETQVDGRVYRALVAFVLGSGRQGQSLLARDEEGRTRELRLSHYPDAPAWDRTSEHPATPPDVAGYLGRPLSPDSVRKCLHCHATTFRAAEDRHRGRDRAGPEVSDRGIGCERCHGPGGHHVQAVALAFPDLAIARPRVASAAAIVALCGQCHRSPRPSSAPAEPGDIRFQAPRLVRSRCYTESGGALSCVTCHNPHRDAETSVASYEAKCRSCHGAAGKAVCSVNPARGCLECHMPRVTGAVPRAVFTDHEIRVDHQPARPVPMNIPPKRL